MMRSNCKAITSFIYTCNMFYCVSKLKILEARTAVKLPFANFYHEYIFLELANKKTGSHLSKFYCTPCICMHR